MTTTEAFQLAIPRARRTRSPFVRCVSTAPPSAPTTLSFVALPCPDCTPSRGSDTTTCQVRRLRLNVHLHVLGLDGVYVEDEQGELHFHTLGAPSSVEVADIARRTALRLHRAFQKRGRSSPWEDQHAFVDSGEADPFSLEEPGLHACYQAAASGVAVSPERAGQPVLRLLVQSPQEPDPSMEDQRAREPVAEALGVNVNVYAKQRVDGRDRPQLERLCRYVMRPPLSQERLQWRPDGRLELTLKNVWKDGTRALVLEPFELLVRLCSAIPPPWFNMIRYFGVLSSHSRHRARVVPKRSDPSRFTPPAAAGDQLDLRFGSGDANTAARTSGRSRWGWLLRHVFRADLDTCSLCGGPMRWLEAATRQADTTRLLAKHGLAPQPPPQPPARVPPEQLPFSFG